MRCPNCGAEIDNNSAFCANCGAKVESEKKEVQAKPVQQPVQQQAAQQQQPMQNQQQEQPQVVINNVSSGPAGTTQIYEVSGSNETLRLIAFIFNLICTILTGFFLLPLAWTIPMTVHTYKIYKGRAANTVCFGVFDLIFVSVVSGVLLLVAQKDQK